LRADGSKEEERGEKFREKEREREKARIPRRGIGKMEGRGHDLGYRRAREREGEERYARQKGFGFTAMLREERGHSGRARGTRGCRGRVASDARGKGCREFARLLTGLSIRKAYLRRLAVRQDAVPPVCVATHTQKEREREGNREGTKGRGGCGAERRGGCEYHHTRGMYRRMLQQRCPNTSERASFISSCSKERKVSEDAFAFAGLSMSSLIIEFYLFAIMLIFSRT